MAVGEGEVARGRALNDAYAELLDHYSLRSTLINAGESHENGVAEQAHYRLKDALDQALMLRGNRDFDSADDYRGFVRKVVDRRNRLVWGKLEQERPHLQPLPPPAPVPEYVNYRARVRKWSTIQAAGRTYTVPSRLIGKEVQVRLYAEHLPRGFVVLLIWSVSNLVSFRRCKGPSQCWASYGDSPALGEPKLWWWLRPCWPWWEISKGPWSGVLCGEPGWRVLLELFIPGQ